MFMVHLIFSLYINKKFRVVKLYLNLCFCSRIVFWVMVVGGGVLYFYLGPCIQNVVWIPLLPIFPPISHDFCYNIKYSLFTNTLTTVSYANITYILSGTGSTEISHKSYLFQVEREFIFTI